MSWFTPSLFTSGDADATVAASLLGEGRSSRLFKALVYDQQIAQSVAVKQTSLILGSIFSIEVVARPGKTPEQIEAGINAELDKFRTAGPDEKEVVRAQNGIETVIVNGLQRLGGFGGVADRLNMYEHYLGDPDYLSKDLARYRATTPVTVKAFASRNAAERQPGGGLRCSRREKLPPGAPKASSPGRSRDDRRRRQRRRAVASEAAGAGAHADAGAACGDRVQAAQRAHGALRAAHGSARGGCAPGRAHRQRRQPRRHTGPRELHRRDAGRGNGLAHGAPDCRRRRAAGRR